MSSYERGTDRLVLQVLDVSHIESRHSANADMMRALLGIPRPDPNSTWTAAAVAQPSVTPPRTLDSVP